MVATATELEAKLTEATEKRDFLLSAFQKADLHARGYLGDDMAVVSGIRRKPNPRADAKRWGSYDKAAAAAQALTYAERLVARLTVMIGRARADESAVCDLASLREGDLVRTDLGWHRVVRVNAKSVTVETGYSWTDRYPLDRIIETRLVGR